MRNHADPATGLSKKCAIVNSVRLSEYHLHIVKSHKVNISALVRAELERIADAVPVKAVDHD